jgi:hypothetical protein
MPGQIFFFATLSLLITHEMDAVRQHEWRVLPLLAWVADDERGYRAFTALHVPIYMLLLWGLLSGGVDGQRVAAGIDIFCIVHVGLHLLFLKHPEYRFRSWLSWALIVGAGLAGGLDLLL